MSIAKADRKLMREINNMHVLKLIRDRGPVARPELAEWTGLGLSTISNIVGELLDNKLVREVGEGDSSGGRRPGLLDLNELARYAFGVKIGPGKAWISLFDLRVRQITIEELEFTLESPPEDVLKDIMTAVERILAKNRIAKKLVLGIGICTSGLVDSVSGSCVFSPILNWKHVNIRAIVQQFSKLDVIVENDVNAYAYGNLLRESNADTTNMICITTGPGVGAGIVLGRQLYRGSRGGAGEFGHVSIDQDGPLCSCGRRGCLEVLASDQFLLRRAQELALSGESPLLHSLFNNGRLNQTTLLLAAQAGDEQVQALYREMGKNLGCGIANLINLFDPDKIVIGGEGAVASEFFVDTAREVAAQLSFPNLGESVEIVLDDGSEDIWLQGVAALMVDQFFTVPLSA
jgi:N-acetylglucosamine repressor